MVLYEIQDFSQARIALHFFPRSYMSLKHPLYTLNTKKLYFLNNFVVPFDVKLGEKNAIYIV